MLHTLSLEDRMRIIQEIVPGKQITLAHIIASPDESLYEPINLSMLSAVTKGAIGIVSMSPSESTMIAADIALKTASVSLGSIDRVSGTLIIVGRLSEVEASLKALTKYCEETLDFTVCKLTKS